MLPNPISSNSNRRIKFRPISLSDTAATTGMLTNPVGAMIPNYDNGGGSNGGGSGLPPVLPPSGDEAAANWQNPNPISSLSGTGFGTTGTKYNRINRPLYTPLPSSTQVQTTSDEQVLYNQEQERLSNLTPMQNSGMYAGTLEYYLSTGQTNSIPAAMAESMGMTQILSQPGSGWSMSSYGNWVYDGSGANSQTPNIVGVSNVNGQTLLRTDTGQRLDQAGNVVWDPATATTDVYGGQFVSGNEKRFERDAYGVLRRVEWKNGRKHLRRGGSGGHYRNEEQKAEQAQFTGSYGVVNFNTGSG